MRWLLVLVLHVGLVLRAGRRGSGLIMGMPYPVVVGVVLWLGDREEEQRRPMGITVWTDEIELWRLRERLDALLLKSGNEGVQGVVGVSIGEVWPCIFASSSRLFFLVFQKLLDKVFPQLQVTYSKRLICSTESGCQLFR